MSKRTREDLKRLQEKSLEEKIVLSKQRIREWISGWGGEDHVCVSFSGGKDSTVLLHLVRSMYPNVKAVYSNTGLEFPEIQSFVRGFENVDVVRPKMRFDEVVTKYGYPIVSKEVAEAIYYARRIQKGSQNVQVERDRKQRELQPGKNDKNSQAVQKYGGGGASRGLLAGTWINPWKEGTTEKMPHRNANDFAGVSGKTGEGGVFNDAETFGDRSLFNKEKWLPLARDAPFLISHKCCNEMKKSPLRIYQRKNKVHPFLGTLADESRLRTQAWLRNGCNAFDASNPVSTPLSFWTTQDILEYCVRYEKEICSVYGDIVCVDEDGNEYDPRATFDIGKLITTGETNTGCIFCMFGAHLREQEPRFIRLKRTHPKQYDYCMRGGVWSPNPYYDPDAPEYDGEWKNWNPEKIWTPGEGGLGMARVIDIFNEMYPDNIIRY